MNGLPNNNQKMSEFALNVIVHIGIEKEKTEKHCIIEGCAGRMHGNLYCAKHYCRNLKHGDPLYGEDKKRHNTCCVVGCNQKPRSGYSAYCETHYYRIRRNGHLNLLPMSISHVTDNGYIKIKTKTHPLSDIRGWISIHRVVLFNSIGPGKHPCHWCGKEVNFDSAYPKDLMALVVDHVDCDKTNNDLSNLVPSCCECNLRRDKAKHKKATQDKIGVWLEFNGERKILVQWAQDIGISPQALQFRIRNGWSIEDALTKPRGKYGPRKQS